MHDEDTEAYEVLADDDKRAEYDIFGSGGGSSSGQRQSQDPYRDFQQRGGQQGGFRRPSRAGGAQWEYQPNVIPEELFKTIFGAGQEGGVGDLGTLLMSYVATFSSKGAWRQRVISLSTREPRGGDQGGGGDRGGQAWDQTEEDCSGTW